MDISFVFNLSIYKDIFRMNANIATEFSHNTFSGQNYESARPKYPKELYQKIEKSYEDFIDDQTQKGIQQPEKPIFIDLGCGPGTATYEIHRTVPFPFLTIGLDPSTKMIEAANEKLSGDDDSLQFGIADESNFNNFFKSKYPESSTLNNDNVNFISCAQCCHWFDFPAFLENSYNILKEGNTGGKLFIFGYIRPVIWEYPELDDLFIRLDYDFEYGFGKYWQQPGRNYLNNLLTDDYYIKAWEQSSFDSIKFERFFTTKERTPFIDDNAHSFLLSKSTTVKHFRDYITTWSAFNKCKRERGEEYAVAIVDKYFNDMFAKVSSLNYDSKITLVWSTYFIEATCYGELK